MPVCRSYRRIPSAEAGIDASLDGYMCTKEEGTEVEDAPSFPAGTLNLQMRMSMVRSVCAPNRAPSLRAIVATTV